TQVHDVDAQFRVDHVPECFFDIGNRGHRAGRCLVRDVSHGSSRSSVMFLSIDDGGLVKAWARASRRAIHPSKAHLIRAGKRATPLNAAASPSFRATSGRASWPRLSIRARNICAKSSASATDAPVSRSVITEAEAWEMEQPTPSQLTAPILGLSRLVSKCTRKRISSPQVGFTWKDS